MMRYDVLVVGGGPAGDTAALYLARAGLRPLIINQMTPGGQLATAEKVANYPGVDGMSGFDLNLKMQHQAEEYGAKTLRARVTAADLTRMEAMTESGAFAGRAMIIATGSRPRTLGLPREEELCGRGVSYCAAVDAVFYRDKTVVVVGGGNTAVSEARTLSRLCKTVWLVHRRDRLRASKAEEEALRECANVHLVLGAEVEELYGADTVDGVRLAAADGESRLIACEGVFIAVGRQPNTELFRGQVALDENGYVLADETTKTSAEGVFAAGDVRAKPLRQIVTAVADGAAAAAAATAFLS